MSKYVHGYHIRENKVDLPASLLYDEHDVLIKSKIATRDHVTRSMGESHSYALLVFQRRHGIASNKARCFKPG